MRIQIDTVLRTIKIEEKTNLGELIKSLEVMFPNDLWKQFDLEVTVINTWTNPIVIKGYPYNPYVPYTSPDLPWWHQQPIITCDTNTVNTTIEDKEPQITFSKSLLSLEDLNKGVYNIDLQKETR